MASSNKATISARERVRKANAERLAAEQARLKQNEDDLVAFFNSTADIEKADSDVEEKIRKIRDEAEEKKANAVKRQATAILGLKQRGESTSAIAEMTELSEAKVRELIRLAKPKTKPAAEPVAEPSPKPVSESPVAENNSDEDEQLAS
ncbi:hypothetical protein R1CP_40360 (plasmid) [Rhodococcus opacus]|uniref:Uncharacterized protein n=1 Tax=Rhodococcus opacus TaxID=37919 RepID=A0A1B1KJ71_RHOOP|nr:hypothetical protein [Rhodococcus opacus]ANS32652.1 hypothetical protein R1CP_40360 [Rhodococcus opacus]